MEQVFSAARNARKPSSPLLLRNKIRDIERLRKLYGSGRWRKLKGIARIRLLDDGFECDAELHWYEAHGIGKQEIKIKGILD